MNKTEVAKLVKEINALEKQYGKGSNREISSAIESIRKSLVESGYCTFPETTKGFRQWYARSIKDLKNALNELCQTLDRVQRDGDTGSDYQEHISKIVRFSRQSFVVFSFDAVSNTYSVK
ncbi:MAG TPA: hypothetical protein VHV10_02630 [Ktedonobacteraceae bacterium]|jgi:hypothetical protein|nr:hypothetical protein [Ktedonobacteraceae bacterium]